MRRIHNYFDNSKQGAATSDHNLATSEIPDRESLIDMANDLVWLVKNGKNIF